MPKSTPQEKARAARYYAANRERVNQRMHSTGIPCQKCGVLRKATKKMREDAFLKGGPVCHDCRRKAREVEDQIIEEIRERRAQRLGPPPPRTGNPRSGRGGTGNARYRRHRLIILSQSDICGLCGHPGAATVDHIIPLKHWTGTKQAFDDLTNLQPAHGSLGATGLVNRCDTCGKTCNQVKGGNLL